MNLTVTALLQHHARRARHGEITNALRNCHVKGLWSVMLHDEPGNRMRLFYADTDHELWRQRVRRPEKMSLAIHRHHCDLSLVPIFGTVINLQFEEPRRVHNGPLFACQYRSAITGDVGSLRQLEGRFWLPLLAANALRSTGVWMKSRDLHTIFVPPNRRAAWLVLEGREDECPSSVCYTNNPHFDTAGMYQPAAELVPQILRAVLREVA